MTSAAVPFRVTIFGPNLPRELQQRGQFHIHREGCLDGVRLERSYDLDPPWTIDAVDREGVTEDIYDPESFLYDPEDLHDRQQFDDDLYFAPCCDPLPYRKGLSYAAPRH